MQLPAVSGVATNLSVNPHLMSFGETGHKRDSEQALGHVNSRFRSAPRLPFLDTYVVVSFMSVPRRRWCLNQ
jgi:hypothetical protein